MISQVIVTYEHLLTILSSKRLEEEIGIEDLCKKTGSRAHARFSVHHIHKVVTYNSFFISFVSIILNRYTITSEGFLQICILSPAMLYGLFKHSLLYKIQKAGC